MAHVRQRDDLAAVGQPTIGQHVPATETNTPVPYSTLRRGASVAAAEREALRERQVSPGDRRDQADPSCRPSPGRRGSSAAHLAVARIAVDAHPLQALHAAKREGSEPRLLPVMRRRAATSAARTRPRASRRCRHGTSRSATGPARSSSGSLPDRWSPRCELSAGMPTRDPVAGSSVICQPPRAGAARRRPQHRPLLRRQQAGDLELVAFLVVLHRLGELVAELAVGQRRGNRRPRSG